ncbi:AEC family transporter [Clostridium niameyense]|uniref:AEC family transporter n=1 Tax=Clostridium niameyense TaxID=1622073 RepID=A0A6M0R6U0_9CLOT|nr:AEC family transporter [Clostridium niameyense]NEZ45962.1 AEC family transporter [Clostridium niameyense]
MENNIINQVLILFIIMLVGVVCRKKEILNNSINKKLSEFLVKVTLPCLIVSSFNYKFTNDMIDKCKMILFYSIMIHIIIIPLSNLIFRRFNDKSNKVLRFASVFSNSAFMGYPVLQALYGNLGVFYGSIFGIPYNIIMLSVGIEIYTGKRSKESFKNILKQPGIIATLVGILIITFSIRIPMPLSKALNSIGSMTTPLSMIVLGVMLSDINVKSMFSTLEPYYASLVRLMIMPFVTYLLLYLLKADQFLLEICVILEAMPTAVLCSVLAEEYDADSVLAAKCVFMTTLLSIITIPIIVSVIT